nr:LysM domain-containing protein [Legionella tunisiensis]
MSSIAKRNNTTVAVLTRLNPSINKKLLRPGQKLVIG